MQGKAFQILLVEDQVRHQKIYEAAITEALPARVRFATTGPEALAALAASEPPDLVLLDLEIPGVPGPEVLAHIKNDPRLRHIPVIILTGHAGPALQLELLDGGADDFIEKGGPPAVLIARLKAQMRHKLAVDRLERLAFDRDLFAAGVLSDISSSKWTIVSLCRAAKDALRLDPVKGKGEVLQVLDKLSAHASRLGAYASDVIQSVRDTQRDPVIAAQDVAQLVEWVIEVLATPPAPSGNNRAAPAPPTTLAPLLWKAPVPLRPVLADRSFLRLALLNVVQAAQRRAVNGGPVTVTVTQVEHDNPEDPRGRRFITTRFADNGKALPPRELAQVFHPGVSVGLALVAKVMARMGGEAKAEASMEGAEGSQGVGMVVSLSLPLA